MKPTMESDLATLTKEPPSPELGEAESHYMACYADKIHDLGGLAADDTDVLLDRYFETAFVRCSKPRQRVDRLIGDLARQKFPLKSDSEIAAITDVVRGGPMLHMIDEKFKKAGFNDRFDAYLSGIAAPMMRNVAN